MTTNDYITEELSNGIIHYKKLYCVIPWYDLVERDNIVKQTED